MAIFHLSARTATRAGGSSAAASADYISRRGKYSKRKLDAVVFCASVNMPNWVNGQSHAPDYWSAADVHERTNGRLFKSVEFALPIELDRPQQLRLVQEYVRSVARTDLGETLPCTFAIHGGDGSNPHCHVMVSERVNDGIARTPSTWFSRACTKSKNAATGGARKTEDLKPKEWLENVRELLARLSNSALEAAGRHERIDHRSNSTRGIDVVPGTHAGPATFAIELARRPSRRAADRVDAGAAANTAARFASQMSAEADKLQVEINNARRPLPGVPDLPSLAAALQQARKAERPVSTPLNREGKKNANDYGR